MRGAAAAATTPTKPAALPSENGQSRSAASASVRSMMRDPATTELPDLQTCEQARLSRDARFDGLFFTAVTSTGIYCRPVCPAPPPRRDNIRYYANAAAAEAAGFRPCLRCRPELAPHGDVLRRGDSHIAQALRLIDAGVLEQHSLAELARQLALSDRQLRRLFVARLGATPMQVHATRRLLFAKQLLGATALPITQIALASGFRSLRRFNAAFQSAYRLAPRTLRKHPDASARAGEPLRLRLGYRPPYDFAALLDFLRARALPGLEQVDADSYARAIGSAERPAWLQVSASGDGAHALHLALHGVAPADLQAVVTRVRRMFDLDADPHAIAAVLTRDAQLRPLLRRHPGLRLPGAWDGFELAVRAVLGQQISVAAARTLALRLLHAHGPRVVFADAPMLTHLFPGAARVADIDPATLGVTRMRAATLHALACAVRDGALDFASAHSLDAWQARCTALPGIGAWTAQYIALRALSHPDAFPANDLVLRRAAANGAHALSAKALGARAESWRPWRAYAVIHLWRHATRSGTST